MKRWFVARLVDLGDGSLTPAIEKPQYTNVHSFRVWSRPGFGWCFGQIGTSNVAQFQGDADIRILPDTTLDQLWSSLSTSTRNAVIAQLQAAGFSTTHIKNSSSIRIVLQGLKRQLQADDDIESGDVRDTP
jgi:hypothetical protein